MVAPAQLEAAGILSHLHLTENDVLALVSFMDEKSMDLLDLKFSILPASVPGVVTRVWSELQILPEVNVQSMSQDVMRYVRSFASRILESP